MTTDGICFNAAPMLGRIPERSGCRCLGHLPEAERNLGLAQLGDGPGLATRVTDAMRGEPEYLRESPEHDDVGALDGQWKGGPIGGIGDKVVIRLVNHHQNPPREPVRSRTTEGQARFALAPAPPTARAMFANRATLPAPSHT